MTLLGAAPGLTLFACLPDWSALQRASLDDGGASDDGDLPDASNRDTAAPSDAGIEDRSAKDTAADAPCTPASLVINEVQVDGVMGASDEFVELYNPGSCELSLAGWQLLYSPASGSNPQGHWTGVVSDKIAAGGYAIIAGQIYPGTATGRFDNGVNGVLSKSGGGIGPFGPDASAATDSVAWEVITAFPHPFARPTAGPAAPQPPSRYAIARTPNGVNSNNSASDFAVTTKPTPGLPN